MTGYLHLSGFERVIIVDACDKEHSTSEVAMKFEFLYMTISRVYREYQTSGKVSNLQHRCGKKKTLKERDHGLLMKILKRDGYATLPEFQCWGISKRKHANFSKYHH